MKNLRDWRNEGVVTAVYEDRWVDVWRKDAIGTSFESLSRTDSRDVWRILFETVAYDAIVIDSSKVLISCLNMPVLHF